MVSKRSESEPIVALERELKALRKRVDRLSDARSFIVPVTSLAPEPLELIKDIPVVLQPTGEDFIATYFDANISATGDNEVEAVANLKDILVAKFKFLDEIPDARLGKGPKRQLQVLRSVIRRGR